MNVDRYRALAAAKAQAEPMPFEDGVRLIEDCKSLFLVAIGELDELELCILLVEGREQPHTVSVSFGEGQFLEGNPVVRDERSRQILVRFPSQRIVSYAVLNESYGEYPAAPQEFTGGLFRTFTKSHLLTYTFAAANGLARIEAERFLAHYQIHCQNHVIDVIALTRPEISSITMR